MTRRSVGAVALLVALGLAACTPDGDAGAGDEVLVAVAANLAPVVSQLADTFSARHDVRVRLSGAATGQLFAQIRSGAPFHVFVAADAERPRRLESEGFTVPGTRSTLAFGRLAAYAPGRSIAPESPWSMLVQPSDRLAIANPRTAPYGAAAVSVLETTMAPDARPTLVIGESVGQAFQFVHSGAAEAGLVAHAQVVGLPREQWALIPGALHGPMPHDVVLLTPGGRSDDARRFLDFLRGPEAAELLRRFGYDLPPTSGPPA